MNSWWQLGEWSGVQGNELALYQITCPFCMERGNFELAFRAQKKKPNATKILYFDTYKCGSCNGYVMVLWSASSFGRVHNYEVLPWPLKFEKYPEHWPTSIGRYWLQAKQNIHAENWDAAAVMARSALQLALRDYNAKGNGLKQEIEDLANKGILPPIMKEWSDQVRELGNVSAHPKPSQDPANPEDARDIVEFLDFLIEYLYNLPHRIKKYRERDN